MKTCCPRDVRKGQEIESSIQPWLILQLAIISADNELPTALPSRVQQSQKLVNQNNANELPPSNDFVKKTLQRRDSVGYYVVTALSVVMLRDVDYIKSSFSKQQPQQLLEKDAPSKVLSNEEEDLIMEGWTLIQEVMDYETWVYLYVLVREAVYLTTMEHPMLIYWRTVQPSNISEMRSIYTILKDTKTFGRKLPPTFEDANLFLGLQAAIMDVCESIPVAVLVNRIGTEPEESSRHMHSCLPNATIQWEKDHSKMVVVALCDVSKDEAIKIDFLETAGAATKQRAGDHLVKYGGQPCGCIKCITSLEDMSANTIVQLGHLHFREDRFDEAIQCYQRALDIDTSLSSTWHAIGGVLLAQNKFREAQEFWRDAASKHQFLTQHEGIALQLAKQEAYGYFDDAEAKVVKSSGDEELPTYKRMFDGKCFTCDNAATKEECNRVIEWANTHQKWATGRHYAVPTNDVAVHTLPKLLNWFNSWMQCVVCPLLERQFQLSSSRHVFCHDAFVVRYEANENHNYLPVHIDESTHSFVLVLNDDFEGGGTYFVDYNSHVSPKDAGSLLTFRGDTLRHGGNLVTRGTRYILAGFLFYDAPNRKRPFVNDDDAPFSFGFKIDEKINA